MRGVIRGVPLRTGFLQQGFNLSDPTVEEALYDSVAMRGFMPRNGAERVGKWWKRRGVPFVLMPGSLAAHACRTSGASRAQHKGLEVKPVAGDLAHYPTLIER